MKALAEQFARNFIPLGVPVAKIWTLRMRTCLWSHGPHLWSSQYKPTIKGILSDGWEAMSLDADFSPVSPVDFFSTHFNPQRRHGYQARSMSKEQFLADDALNNVFRMDPKPKHLKLKGADNRLREKRPIYAELRSMRAGPFMAKHLYRVWTNFKHQASGPTWCPSIVL